MVDDLTEREWEVIRQALDYYSRAGNRAAFGSGCEVAINAYERVIARDLWDRFSRVPVH